MKRWTKRFLSTTRGKVVQLLRRGEASVSDLSDALDLTDNAVRSHLNTLERDGLVRIAGKRSSVRKPETLYGLTEEADQLFPHAYHLLFNRLLETLEDHLSADDIEGILREVGERLGSEQNVPAGASQRQRAEHAMAVLAGMGGMAELNERDDHFLIRGFSCPLAAAVQQNAEVCRLAESLLAAMLGSPVREQCERNGNVHCAFRVEKENMPS